MRFAIPPPDDQPVSPIANLPAHLEAALRANHETVRDYARRSIPSDLKRLIDADDILQDTYLEFFRRSKEVTLSDPDHIRRLLLTIARHQIIDQIRVQRAAKRGGQATRLEELKSGSNTQPLIGLLEQLAVYERTPSQSAIAHEVAARVQHSLDLLPKEYAECLRMRHIEQKSVAETAGLMGRSEGAIHMLNSRALAQLKKELLKSAALV